MPNSEAVSTLGADERPFFNVDLQQNVVECFQKRFRLQHLWLNLCRQAVQTQHLLRGRSEVDVIKTRACNRPSS